MTLLLERRQLLAFQVCVRGVAPLKHASPSGAIKACLPLPDKGQTLLRVSVRAVQLLSGQPWTFRLLLIASLASKTYITPVSGQVKLQLSEEAWARRSEKTVLQALVRLADMHDALAAAAAANT